MLYTSVEIHERIFIILVDVHYYTSGSSLHHQMNSRNTLRLKHGRYMQEADGIWFILPSLFYCSLLCTFSWVPNVALFCGTIKYLKNEGEKRVYIIKYRLNKRSLNHKCYFLAPINIVYFLGSFQEYLLFSVPIGKRATRWLFIIMITVQSSHIWDALHRNKKKKKNHKFAMKKLPV